MLTTDNNMWEAPQNRTKDLKKYGIIAGAAFLSILILATCIYGVLYMTKNSKDTYPQGIINAGVYELIQHPKNTRVEGSLTYNGKTVNIRYQYGGNSMDGVFITDGETFHTQMKGDAATIQAQQGNWNRIGVDSTYTKDVYIDDVNSVMSELFLNPGKMLNCESYQYRDNTLTCGDISVEFSEDSTVSRIQGNGYDLTYTRNDGKDIEVKPSTVTMVNHNGALTINGGAKTPDKSKPSAPKKK